MHKSPPPEPVADMHDDITHQAASKLTKHEGTKAMRRTIMFETTVVLGVCLGLPASAQEMRWQKREGDGRVCLAFEIPDSGNQKLSLIM